MSELQKRILLDLFTAPVTIIPLTAGVSLLLLAVALGGGWGFFGFCLCLLGLGSIASNFLLNRESLVKKSLENIEEEKRRERNRRLDELDAVLSSNREPRDQNALRNLRTLYDEFVDDVKAGRVSAVGTGAMFEQVEQIFQGCVTRLERQHQIWLTSRKVTGSLKDGLLKQRDDLLAEVEASIETLAGVINEVLRFGLQSEPGRACRSVEPAHPPA